MLKIGIHEILDAGVYEADLRLPADRISLDLPDRPRLTQDVAVHVRGEAVEGHVTVFGRAETSAAVSCSRCLEPARIALSADFEVHADPGQHLIDLTEEIRQGLVLSVPPKPLCKPDCRGLCARCGKNLNQGPCTCPKSEKETPFSVLKRITNNK